MAKAAHNPVLAHFKFDSFDLFVNQKWFLVYKECRSLLMHNIGWGTTLKLNDHVDGHRDITRKCKGKDAKEAH